MIKAVLFDLDGTLVDSAQEICDSVRKYDASVGLRIASTSEFRPYLAKPIVSFYREFHGMDDEQTKEAVFGFRKIYAETCLGSKMFDGIPGLLEKLRSQGVKMAIITAKGDMLAHTMCDRCGLTPYMDAIYGSVDNYVTPKDEMIAKCLSGLGIDASEAVYVGDCHSDCRASAKAGIRFVGVTYGYGFVEGEGSGKVMLAGSVAELESALSGL